MGELLFIGMGLFDEKDLSLRAIEELGGAGAVFSEQYTSELSPGSIERLEKRAGVRIMELTREQLESEKPVLDALELEGTVVLLVAGEAMAATTHVSLRLSAERRGHRWRILHGPSIITAAASLAGLSHYKFGRLVSLPYPNDQTDYRPVSPYRAIATNFASGLHTLILLDLDTANHRYLTADRALHHLGSLETELKGGIAMPTTEFCVVARAGAPDASVWVGERKELEIRDFGPPLHSLILPGPPLHFMEEEAISSWRSQTKRRGSP